MNHIPTQALEDLCGNVDGACGLYVSVPQSGETFTIQPDRIFRAASTIKVPLLALLLRDAEQGRIDLEAKRRVAPENRVVGAGILQSLSPDLELSLFDLAELMIVLSDNTATNEVIDAVGIGRLNSFCQELGFSHTALGRKMMLSSSGPAPVPPGTLPVNRTSAGDLGRMLELTAAGEFVSPWVSRTILRIMSGQRLLKLSARLPAVDAFDPRTDPALPPEGHVLCASKGGLLTRAGINHDAGVFRLPDGRCYVVVMLTETPDVHAALDLISQAGLVMYEAMK